LRIRHPSRAQQYIAKAPAPLPYTGLPRRDLIEDDAYLTTSGAVRVRVLARVRLPHHAHKFAIARAHARLFLAACSEAPAAGGARTRARTVWHASAMEARCMHRAAVSRMRCRRSDGITLL
jgi:hypothetical protein